MNTIYKEAKRLYALGFAIHWLHPKSKRPVESGWGSGPRKSWSHLKETFREGYNVGVRLGTPSKFENGYLCVVDVDVKSVDPKHRGQAEIALRELLGETLDSCPAVTSGRGNGSAHYYVVTDEPFKTFNPAASDEIVKLHMPSKKASKREKEELTNEELEAGIRLGPAWEISLYSDGRQVVLPPSLHPDTGRAYSWQRPLKSADDLEVLAFDIPAEDADSGNQRSGRKSGTRTSDLPADGGSDGQSFRIRPVEVSWLPISDRIRDGIIEGKDVNDRSAFLLPAANALLSAGLDRDEILSVLTDPKTFLGACAYDHAKTKNRTRAANWVWKYTLRAVMEGRSAESAFEDVAVDEPKILSPEEVQAQTDSFEEDIDWRTYLEKNQDGKYRNSLHNAKTILKKVFGNDCMKFNEFANVEEIWGPFPWVPKRPKELHDIDIKMLKDWFVKEWGYEPSDDKLISALAVIAFENKYHPVKTWVEDLPEWDGQDRIDALLDHYIPCEGDAELRAVIGRRFMVALIKRIYEPGCQSDYLLVLEGLQGLHKSSAFRALIGDDWFSDATFNVNDKDAVMVIFSKWLIEFGELSTLDRTTAEHTKAFITRRTDRIRAPFDRKARDYPRQCLFVGSTNKGEYLKDDSGNRRYWPFRVMTNCLISEISKDREQLFAEAKYYYDVGEITYLKEDHLKKLMLDQQEAREMHDVLIEQIDDIIQKHEAQTGEIFDGFSIKFFFDSVKLGNVKNDQYGSARVGTALRKLGYEQRRQTSGDRQRLWWATDKRRVNGVGGKTEKADEIGDFF